MIPLLKFLDLPYAGLHRIISCTVGFDAVKFVRLKIRRLSKMLHHPFWRLYTELSLCFKSSCSSSNAHTALPSTLWLLLILEDCGRKDLQNSKEKIPSLTESIKWGVQFQSFVYAQLSSIYLAPSYSYQIPISALRSPEKNYTVLRRWNVFWNEC